MADWEFADIGFDTTRKLWFIDLYDRRGRPDGWVSNMVTTEVEVRGGDSTQFQWKDQSGNFWHVRERIFRRDVERIEQESSHDAVSRPGKVVVHALKRDDPRSTDALPDNWDTLNYAFDLGTGRGFAEFFGPGDEPLCQVRDRWIITENLPRKTVGEYPKIRFSVMRDDVSRALLTDSALVLCGRHNT